MEFVSFIKVGIYSSYIYFTKYGTCLHIVPPLRECDTYTKLVSNIKCCFCNVFIFSTRILFLLTSPVTCRCSNAW